MGISPGSTSARHTHHDCRSNHTNDRASDRSNSLPKIKGNYPAVLARREELRASLSTFFRAHLSRALAPITAATPERCYVLDLMFVGERWYLVELNPFATSSAGHRFAGAEYEQLRWRSLAPGALPELRLLERTPALSSEQQTDAAVPARWRALLEGCGNCYDIAEADYGAAGSGS
jgi:hypothetical protein